MTQPRLKAVLFDMDDTLIDWSNFSGDWREVEVKHLGAVYDYLAACGRPLDTDLDTLLDTFGQQAQDAWASARTTLRAPHLGRVLMDTLAAFGFVPDDEIGMEECLRAYDWCTMPGVTVFPDVPDALAMLVERKVDVAIVTNAFAPMTLRDVELQQYDLLRYFPNRAGRISAADVGYLKPHPEIFRHALQAVGAAPEEVVFVGDNPVADISGAQSAGMRAILRVKEHSDRQINDLIVPDEVIHSLEQLEGILDRWYGEW